MPHPMLPPPTPPPADIDFEVPRQAPAPTLDHDGLFVADGPAAAQFVWTLASEGLPEERLLPKEDESQPAER